MSQAWSGSSRVSATIQDSQSVSDSAAAPFRFWWGLAGCAVLMALVLLFGVTSDGSRFPVDKGNFWYFWQLEDPTVWTRLSAWVPYALHQLGIWYLIAMAREVRPKYIFGLHYFNVLALGLNAFFIVVHIAQTRLFYDALAQDVHEATSMMSVILMLLMSTLMLWYLDYFDPADGKQAPRPVLWQAG